MKYYFKVKFQFTSPTTFAMKVSIFHKKEKMEYEDKFFYSMESNTGYIITCEAYDESTVKRLIFNNIKDALSSITLAE